MKLLLLMITLAVSSSICQSLRAEVGASSFDFYSGKFAAMCLTMPCQVILGEVLTDGTPRDGQLVRVRVLETLFGPEAEEIVELPFTDPVPPSKSYSPLHDSWIKVTFPPQARIVAFIPQERIFDVDAGVPLRVYNSELTLAAVRRITREAKTLVSFPEGISKIVSALADNTDPAMAGYAFTYVTRIVRMTDPEQTVGLLHRLLAMDSVPKSAAGHFESIMAVTYSYLQPADRAKITAQFVKFALDSDKDASLAGFDGLAHIDRHFHEEVAPLISPLTRKKLREAYNSQDLRDGKRHEAFVRSLDQIK